MSVILLGMTKPEKCKYCNFCKQTRACEIPFCELTWKNIDDTGKVLPECPIEAIDESELVPDGNKKPPLGIMPRAIWEEKRKKDIIDAMKRYMNEGAHIPLDWINELHDLEYNF